MSGNPRDTGSTLGSSMLCEDLAPSQLNPITTLGRGSYGKVVLAKVEEPEVGQDDLVAVKIIAKSRIKNKAHLAKTETELRVLKEVAGSSPFLVATQGAFQTDNCLIITMPYSAGGELFFHLQREGKFSEARVRTIMMQIVLGLEHLHSHGVLYRDLKPENVLVTKDGHCQLADFGLSKFLTRLDRDSVTEEDKSESTRSTSKKSVFGRIFSRKSFSRKSISIPDGEGKSESGLGVSPSSDQVVWGTTKTRCGTPAYQCPEIIQVKEHSLEADWWALGVLMYELLTGEPPFFANTVKEVYEVILKNQPRWPKRVSERSKGLIQPLLTTERRKRLGYGVNGASDVMSNAFFVEAPADRKSIKNEYPTWEQVSKLATSPVVYLSESGIVGTPEDAVFFHADFTTIDVREYVAPAKSNFSVEGFKQVEMKEFDKFVSADPIPVVEKNGEGQNFEEDDDTTKKNKN